MYFVGRSSLNNVPVGNGRVLAWVTQYKDGRPADWLRQVFYPNYDLSSSVLGEEGTNVLIEKEGDRVWYDAEGIIREKTGQLGEVVSIDDARYLKGCGVYEVLSHKGDIALRTRTWAPVGIGGLVRTFEIASVTGRGGRVNVYPVVHLPSVARGMAHIYLSRLSEGRWVAVSALEAIGSGQGDVAAVIGDRKVTVAEHGSDPKQVVFRVKRNLPRGTYSRPVFLFFGFGKDKDGAMNTLQRLMYANKTLLEDTLDWWERWHREGLVLETSDPRLDYLWKTSLTVIRSSLQADGAPIIAGFKPYQGNVWIRDGIWMANTLADTGHTGDALKVMRRLRRLLQRRSDGNFYFAYNCATELPNEHSYENDSTALLIEGVYRIFRSSGDQGVIREFRQLVHHCADWILANRDETGMVRPCAGISEAFGPHLDRSFEHMVWTSALSAHALKSAASMLQVIGESGPAREYIRAAADLTDAVKRTSFRESILCRSAETDRLDASVLHFFDEFAVFSDKKRHAATVAAIRERLVDPIFGGVWRHEDLITEEGDMRPWPFYTFLLGQACLKLGDARTAWEFFGQALGWTSFCGLVPELMYTRDLPRGVALPSFAQGSFTRAMLAHRRGKKGTIRPPHLERFAFRDGRSREE